MNLGHSHSRVEFVKKLVFVNLDFASDHGLGDGACDLFHLEKWITEIRFEALQWVIVVFVTLVESHARKESHTLLNC